jgi:Zn-finger nucleic acid-binding protein
MTEESHRGVQVDLCHRCHGVWFDGGELAAYQDGKGAPDLSGVPDSGSTFEPSGDADVSVTCPRCEHDILRGWVVGKRPVMRCTTCGGLFLRLSGFGEDRPRPDNVLNAAIRAFEEIVQWLLGHEKKLRR